MDNCTLEYFADKFELDLNLHSPININISRFTIINFFKDLDFKVGAEIGTEHGFYAQKICQANPQLKLYCVDPYIEIPYYDGYKDQLQINEHFATAQKRLENCNHEFIKKLSMDAVKDFEPNSLDFVFIDANHYFEWVVNDIIYWSRIVKPGGIVFGHDYSDQFHVKHAVHAYMSAYKVNPWFVLHKKGLIDNWMFIRQDEDTIW
jgi:SAM-dependent methyltransferase